MQMIRLEGLPQHLKTKSRGPMAGGRFWALERACDLPLWTDLPMSTISLERLLAQGRVWMRPATGKSDAEWVEIEDVSEVPDFRTVWADPHDPEQGMRFLPYLPEFYAVSEIAVVPFAAFIVVELADGQVAATTRLDGSLGLPGGKVDPGEDPREAVLREAREEGWELDAQPDDLREIYLMDVEGRPVVWYAAPEWIKASPLDKYKESHRGIVPVAVDPRELTSMGNAQALEAAGLR